MAVLFWTSVALILYTYAGYPLLVWAIARLRKARRANSELAAVDLPSVSVCIAVHNEQSRIAAKLDNIRRLDYPADRMEFIFSSDGSTDGTAETLRAAPDVKFVDGPRAGKCVAIARAVEVATGEVVVFTDARQMLSANSIRALVLRLAQPGVGVASGLLTFRSPEGEEAQGADLYWRYESWIRRCESRTHSLIGASGALYAMRRSDFRPPRPGTILDDFEIPIQVLRQGLRIVQEDSAIALDDASSARGAERIRKIRTLAGNFQSFAQQPWLFSPLANPAWWQFVSHKVLRLAIPFLMVLALATSVGAKGTLYDVAAALQAGFYLIAISGLLLPGLRRIRAVNIASVFFELNMAAVIGLYVYATGQSHKAWRPTA